MRIFTLGKNGITLFYFAFILFSGTYSYGQQVDSCGVTDQNTETAGNQQYFCDSQEAELNNLLVAGENITFYSDAGYTNVLDATTLLIGGRTYYIDADGCQSSVTVNIFNEPQILGINETRKAATKQSSGLGEIVLCVADESNPDIQVDILRTNAPDDSVIWFYSLTQTGDPIRINDPSTTDLIDNAFYYAARENPYTGCISNTSEVRVRLNSESAPTAQENQEFCGTDQPTVGDIIATGDNRYYTTATSQVEISRNQPLVDGRTYYVSTLGETCESALRTPVTVTIINELTIDTVSLQVCTTEVDNPTESGFREFYLNQAVNAGLPDTGTFNPTMSDLVEQYNTAGGTGTFTTNYTAETVCGEVTLEISVEITEAETAEAGSIADISIACDSSEIIILNDVNLSDDAIAGGTFSAAEGVLTSNGNFDPSIGAGEYSITYTVDSGAGCVQGEDFTTFTITVNEGNVDADDVFVQICTDEVDNPTVSGFRTYYRNQVRLYTDLPDNGTFNPTAAELQNQYELAGGIGTFPTNYTVNTDCGEVTIEIAVQITESQIANAGDIENITVACNSNEIITLDESLLSSDAVSGGTFTAAEGVLNTDNNFDPSIGVGEYIITYSVDETVMCIEGEDSTSFTITVESSVYAGEDQYLTYCTSEIETLITNPQLALNFFQNILEDQEGDVDTTGEFDATVVDVLNYYRAGDFTEPFTTTYRVGEEECNDEAFISITIIEDQVANAGEISSITVPCGSSEIILLNNSILSEDATPGGTFSAAEGVLNENGNFDPSIGAGEYLITYSVGDIQCVQGEDSTTFTITVNQGSNETDDVLVVVCTDEVDNPTVSGFRTFYRNQVRLHTDLPDNGTFSPNAAELLNQYQQAGGIGIFASNYTVNTTCGEVTIQVAAEIIESREANAGEIEDITVACDASEVIILDESILAADAISGGIFTANENVLNEDGNFSSSIGAGEYIITYTVDESIACVTGTDSTTFTITVTDGNTEANAGEIADMTVYCATADVLVLNESILSEDATLGGTFTADEGVLDENGNFDASIGAGEYIITYTVSESNACVTGTDSTSFTVTVIEGDVELDPISNELCSTMVDNPTVNGFRSYFRNLVSSNTNLPLNGTFNPGMADLVAQYEENPLGTFTSNYTVSTDCGTVSLDINVQINDPEDANAGENIAVEYCIAQNEDIQLTSLLSEGAQTTGTFSSPYEDGIFNPSVAGLGEFTLTYTVIEGDCVVGEDSATITITVIDTVEAPEVDNAVFCVSEGATVADLDAERGLNWYTTADLGTPAPADQVLVEGPYFVTQTNEGGCESEAAEVTVTLEDTPAPTLTQGGNVFCEVDNPTIADLNNNIVQTGNITWYDAATGGEAYSSADRLENGVTYYASLTDATSTCESSQRLAVTVNLETCELLIPEAFSPNGDGINDRFEIENLSAEYPNFGMEIYNRWGNKVFTGNSSNSTWDGTSDDGSLGDGVLPVGVYFYILNFNDGQTAPIQGRVYLSR